jgi:AcrR family transcriptional regulator
MPPEERRAAIVESVLPLLIEHGSTVTTRQLALAAGVSEGTVFNVFADKDELLAVALDTAMDQAPFERAIGELEPSIPFEQRLVQATELIQRRIVDIWRLLSQIGEHHQPSGHSRLPDSPALIALLAGERHRLRTEPRDAARQLRALTLALTHPMLAVEPRSAAAIVDVFLHGNAAPGARGGTDGEQSTL